MPEGTTMTRTHRRATTIAAVVTTVALALTGCSTSGSDSSSNSLTVALQASPLNLDYTTSAGAAIPQALLYNVYESLVKLDDTGAIVDLLAVSHSVSDDRLTYTFTLQPDVTFSNGTPLTADSVKFSLDRLKTDWTTAAASQLSEIASVAVVSESEVAITLSAPDNTFLYNLAGPAGTIFSPDGVSDLASTAVGTGPYTVQSYETASSLELVANPNYWGGTAGLDAITINYFADVNSQSNALLSGGADAIIGLSQASLLSQFTSDDRFVVTEGTTNGEVMLSMNNQRAPFNDVRVRQAVRYAIDNQAALDTVQQGYGSLIGSMVPPTDPWFEDLTGDYAYNPDRARELLAEANVSNPTVSFAIPNQPPIVAAAQVVQSQLAEVGITATITTLEFPSVWLDQVFTRADYDLSLVNHVEPRDIVQFSNPNFYFGYQNDEANAILAAAIAGTEDEYVAGMADYAARISDDAAAEFLYLLPQLNIAATDVDGLTTNSTSQSIDLTGVTRGN
jgi:peptide/nickel transport system substrate-binding protein